MKVGAIKKLMSEYSDDTELMIAWFDKDQYEYVFGRELPQAIWEKAVAEYDKADLSEFNEHCDYFVYWAKDQLSEVK